MIIIHSNFMVLPILNIIRLLLLSLTLVTASDNDSEVLLHVLAHVNQPLELKYHKLPSSLATLGDLFQINLGDDITLSSPDFSSDQLFYDEPQMMLENYNDHLPQEPVDKSNLGAFQNTINQGAKVPQLPVYLNKDSNALSPSNKYKNYQFPINKSTFGEHPHLYTDQFVKSKVPPMRNMNEGPPPQHQFDEVNDGFVPFNQVYVNQQTFLDQTKNIKLSQLSIDPSAYWHNRYQYSYFPDDMFTTYEPHIYKPLDSEIYTEFHNSKEQLTEPLHGLPFNTQLQTENDNEGQIQLDQIKYYDPNQVNIDQPIQGDHQVLSYNDPSQYPFSNNEDIQDIYEVQDDGQNEPMDRVHKGNMNEPLWFEVNKNSNVEPSWLTFEQQHDGIAPEVVLNYIDGDNPHNVPIYQGSKAQATYAYQENKFISQPSPRNHNGKNIFSEDPINEINNEPGTGFNEQSDVEKRCQTLVDDANISYPQASIELVNGDKDSQVPTDKASDIDFAQEHIKELPTGRSSEFENNKLNNKQEESVTPSLLFMRIMHGALHQVDEAIKAEVEQDFNSKTSQFYDNTNEKPPQLTSGNGNNDVLHRSEIDQITTWESPLIHIDQAVYGDHQSKVDQFIITEAPQILFNQATNIDLAINNIESQEYIKLGPYIDNSLIQIDLSNGILQSAGNTIDINGPYSAVDYSSSERYSTFWNPLDMPFGFSDYYIIFDIKASHTVTIMYIMNYGDTVHDITAFTLEVWDGSNKWRIIRNFFCQAGIGTSQEFRGFIGSGRYWKFTATKTASGYQPWLVELGFHGLLDNLEEDQGYLDETSSEIYSELEYSSDSVNDSLIARAVARQKIIASVHVVSWVYYLVGLVVLGLAMLFMACLIMYLAKKRNGLYNITLVMGKKKEDLVTPVVTISKDYTTSAPPALPPASAPEAELDSQMIQTRIQ